MRLIVESGEMVAFGRALETSPAMLRQEMLRASQAVVAQGTALAQENAPRMDGILAGSIQPIGAVTHEGGEFGTSLIYAFQREYGGVIRPKKGKYLWFKVNGKLVRAKSVNQKGSFYMRRTASQLSPIVYLAYQRAVNRVIESFWG